ncbi:MAG: hypothetical protein JW384_01888 [Nitrosomonadaceae bacterium]|nr:hypothetical protein [Nitrosomonadaceae bacterium]
MPYKDEQQQKEAKQRHYARHKAKFLSRVACRRDTRSVWFKLLKSLTPCLVCAEKHPACIDYHHINSDKDSNVSRLVNDLRSSVRVEDELRKCIPLCSNCHRKVHDGSLVVTSPFDWDSVLNQSVSPLPK